jgi:hypothetical protein
VKPQPPQTPPAEMRFDPTPEIFATDSGGSFSFPLLRGEERWFDTGAFDEMRLVFSVWHPSNQRTIDLDRAYVELRAAFDPEHEHYTKIAEIEPVVPAYGGGETFDGWIVLPVLGTRCAFTLVGSGFEGRARLQVRAHAYLVS